MIIRRSAELRVNLGNYEHVIISGAVEIDSASLPEGMSAIDSAQALLEQSLQEDIAAARDASGLTADQSFIFHWKQENTE